MAIALPSVCAVDRCSSRPDDKKIVAMSKMSIESNVQNGKNADRTVVDADLYPFQSVHLVAHRSRLEGDCAYEDCPGIAALGERPAEVVRGTERIVSYLTEELVRQGHEVTLFASGDSVTRAKLEAPCQQALRLNTGIFNREAPLIQMMEQVFAAADQFDLIHSHLDFLAFSLSRRCRVPVVTTLHGRLDLPELVPVFRDFAELPLVSISDSQRKPLPWCNWANTVYHGLPHDLYKFHPEPGKYLAFLGRVSPKSVRIKRSNWPSGWGSL